MRRTSEKERPVSARLVQSIVLSLAATFAVPARAQTAPGSHERLKQETTLAVRNKLSPLLAQYCKDACSIVDIKVEVEEQISESDDLGFESVVGDDVGGNLFVSKVVAEVQVDNRVTAANRERLGDIVRNNLATLGTLVDVVWKPVTVPQIGQTGAAEEDLKSSLQQRLAGAVEQVFDTYCPEQCVLSQVAIDGALITADEAVGVPESQLVRDKNGAILKLAAVDVEVGMDAALASDVRTKIANVVKAKTRFAAPVNLDVQVSAFPESYAKKQEKEAEASNDPFGLNKLRETLKIFRELAGTKEIITSSTSDSRTKESLKSSNSQETSNTNATNSSADTRSSSAEQGGQDLVVWAVAIGGLLILGGLIVALVMRFSTASRDARLMVEASERRAGGEATAGGAVAAAGTGKGLLTDAQRKDLAQRMRNEDVREELIKIFLDAPKVAKETFSRLLQEEGVEETARYVHIFGHLVIFELLGDPNLQRDLYELSEYYHKSEFDFSPEEEGKLLGALRTRVTANEIRVLTRKQMDKFDFLLKLDATQIYNLISEEKPQVQSIVLTQLDHKRRRAVFDMYTGPAKVDLMRELCRADAIPKEYLSNVAKALHKKVVSRPEFDTEQLRSSDILLDLLEKAELVEQRALMQNLVQTNPDAARGIKIRLVTIEIMPYLKDGHLLEIILGMERDDLLAFLVGTREHIRALILSKAPEELAESWLEDLQNFRRLDEQNYRLIEMKVLSRIRSLANNGVINLLDINDMIFGKAAEAAVTDPGDVVGLESDSAMVA
jgi:flagellar motor switch protein FliG